jgi:hypothetical protein
LCYPTHEFHVLETRFFHDELLMQPDASPCKGSKRKLEEDAAADEPSSKTSCAPAVQFHQQTSLWTAEWIESLANYLLLLPLATQLTLMQQCIVGESSSSSSAAAATTAGDVVVGGGAPQLVQQKPIELPYMRPAPSGSNTLVLCMVYAAPRKGHTTSHGQEGRDYMRLKSLEVHFVWSWFAFVLRALTTFVHPYGRAPQIASRTQSTIATNRRERCPGGT